MAFSLCTPECDTCGVTVPHALEHIKGKFDSWYYRAFSGTEQNKDCTGTEDCKGRVEIVDGGEGRSPGRSVPQNAMAYVSGWNQDAVDVVLELGNTTAMAYSES